MFDGQHAYRCCNEPQLRKAGLMSLCTLDCVSRYFAHVKCFEETGNALLLHKALRQRLWSGSALCCRQLPGIGKLLAERLAAAQCGSLHALAALDARRIEAITQRNYPFGVQPCGRLVLDERDRNGEHEFICLLSSFSHVNVATAPSQGCGQCKYSGS